MKSNKNPKKINLDKQSFYQRMVQGRFHGAWLLLFSTMLLLCGYLYQKQGISAVLILALLVFIYSLIKLTNIQYAATKQIEQVLKALANNDPTLGLSQQSELSRQFDQVREKIQQNRLENQMQAQYLETLMIHLDVSILVIDEDDQIVQHNPASEQLLGNINGGLPNLNELGELGVFIQTANKSCRATLSLQIDDHPDTLSVHISCCKIQGKALKLVSLQSIYQALVTKEQQAYKRLTRVLTHEVANSITPLASLAETATTLVPDTLVFEEQEDKDDLILALNTIASRTEHLSKFIKSFHKITALPQPQLSQINPNSLIENVMRLFQNQAKKDNIIFNLETQSSCLLMADAAQIEQVLINLINNAFYAVNSNKSETSTPNVSLRLWQPSSQQLSLDVSDNGSGIATHIIEQIFVPFFTTKQQGSGIGLSLSKQIMLNHGGDLNYIKPSDEQGTCFRLTFA
ncbi:MAG: ATP-binding protein [Colwellia sp.]|nr:ATP-binding protein [Colwellia sp.]